LWVFIKHQIISYVLNFLVEILLILTYGSTDQAMNDSPFHVMWLVEVRIMTCMSRFPVHFRGQLRISLHDQDVQERKRIINFNLRVHCEFDGRSKAEAVDGVKKLLQFCWSMWPSHGSFVDVYWFVVCCTHCHFLEVFREYYAPSEGGSQVLVLYRVFGAGIATGYRLYSPDSIPSSAEFLSSPQRPDRLRGSPSLLFNGYGGLFPRPLIGKGVKLTTHLHAVPRLT
jgi:hypothetical protein